MRIGETDVLIVPGLGATDPGHWQQRWLKKFPNAALVEHADWHRPDRDAWAAALARAVMMATRPVVLVAHSMGVAAVAHAAGSMVDTKVRGAFLVSLPDLENNKEMPDVARLFAPLPRDPLPFPSLLVASTTDPLGSVEVAVDFASAWGADFHQAGDAGHIDIASGHGPWPEGLVMFTRLMQRL